MSTQVKIQTVDDIMESECCGQPMLVSLQHINGGKLPVLSCQECESYTILPWRLWQEYVDRCVEIARANRQYVAKLEAAIQANEDRIEAEDMSYQAAEEAGNASDEESH